MSLGGHEHEHYEQQDGPRIGVRALLSAGDRQPLVGLTLPLAGPSAQQVRLTAEEASELAGRLLTAAHMARYDACVYAALSDQTGAVSAEVQGAVLSVIVAARERMQEQG